MQSLLDEIFNVAISAEQHRVLAHKKEQEEFDAYEYLTANLHEKQKEQFKKFEDAVFNNLAETEERFFNLGFKTGVMLLIETLNVKD